MSFTSWATGDLVTAAKLNNDNTFAVGTDTIRTITVTHSWTASQTFTGGWAAASACTITATSASSFAVGRQGATDPVLKVDASAASVATGISITGAAAAAGAAIAVISSGTNEGLSVDAKGTGSITLGGVSTGNLLLRRKSLVMASASEIGAGYSLEVWGAADSLMLLNRSGAANTTDECAYVMTAKDAGGTARKVMSISSKWSSTSATNGYSVLRINSTYQSGGTQTDDLQVRMWGGVGITLFGTSDTDEPSAGTKLKIRGRVDLIAATGTGTAQRGQTIAFTATSASTTNAIGQYVSASTEATAFTCGAMYGLFVDGIGKGAGSTITTGIGLYVEAQENASTNWAIYCNSSATSGGVTFRTSALATNATVGHLFIPSSAGAPTGVPASIPTGQVALQFDSTNNKLYVYDGGWISTAALT